MTTPSSEGLAAWLFRQARRVVIFVIGSTVLLIGILMIVAPGPAFIVIPLGLAILATEFVWAKRWLVYARRKLEEIAGEAAKFTRADPPPDTDDHH